MSEKPSSRGAVLARGLSESQVWPLRRSSDLFELRYGKALTESARRPGEVPVYGSNGQTGWHDVPLFSGPGIVVGRKGMGHLGVEWADRDYWVIDTAYSLHPSPEIDLKFAFYLVGSVGVDHLKYGTSNPSLTREAFGAQCFPVPPLPEQQAIAEVLGALDDKIAANTKLAATADRLARVFFLGSLSGAGEVPLSSTARFVNGKAFTKDASGTGRVVVRIAELNSGIGGSTVYSDIDVDDRYLARAGDILFAWSGSLTLHRWFREDAIVNQHIFKVIPNDGYPAWLVYQLIESKLAAFRAIAANKATTMGHIQRHHLDEPVRVPPPHAIDQLNTLMEALWSASLTALRENRTLAATRDALLPQLMSGKLRVRDAEAVASGALR